MCQHLIFHETVDKNCRITNQLKVSPLSRIPASISLLIDPPTLGTSMIGRWRSARKNILRTHTTAVSARMLYKLAQKVIWFKSRIITQLKVLFRTLNLPHLLNLKTDNNRSKLLKSF